MRRWAMVTALATAIGASGWSHGQAPGPDMTAVRASLANPSIPVADRAAQALEAAGDLDRLAQEAGSVAERRSRWAEAAALLADFARDNPDAESAPMVRFQAAVYLWAEGRSHADRVEMAPADAAARSAAADRFDRAIGLLRASGGANLARAADPLAQNVRFRLAQSLADRAAMEPEDAPSRGVAEREALALLERPITEPRLRGFALLLRAEVANRLGQYTQSQFDVEEAEKADPSLSPAALARARVASLVGRSQFTEARKVASGSKVDEATRSWLALRILLAQRRLLSSRADRDELDVEVFEIAAGLRALDRPESSRALMDLARAIGEPNADRPPGWWDLLAEGQQRLGNLARAGRLASQGADRAEVIGQAGPAAALRVKAGALLFEAEKFADADAPLARVAEDERAPRDLRARAGMLRALARGRALAAKQPGATRDAYFKALEDQVRRFPDEAATGEARWLLGQVRLAAGRRDEAIALWSAVPRAHARWLEARLAAADRSREVVDDLWVARDRRALEKKFAEARRALAATEGEASTGDEAAEVAIRLALLELTPEVGHPAEAVEACDRVLKAGASPGQHQQARLIRLAALARAGRLVEAEREALNEARGADPSALMLPLRLLDRAAGEAEADLNRRRLGLVYRLLTGRLAGNLKQVPPRLQDEARLRITRALMFAGDPAAARRELAAWGGPGQGFDDALLRDLADTYFRLEAYPMAADAERLRASKLPPGSPSWFEARYNLALAYFRHARGKDARQVIDATAILHPELGGDELRAKFERLRQRLAQE